MENFERSSTKPRQSARSPAKVTVLTGQPQEFLRQLSQAQKQRMPGAPRRSISEEREEGQTTAMVLTPPWCVLVLRLLLGGLQSNLTYHSPLITNPYHHRVGGGSSPLSTARFSCPPSACPRPLRRRNRAVRSEGSKGADRATDLVESNWRLPPSTMHLRPFLGPVLPLARDRNSRLSPSSRRDRGW
ncbi:hypothetical protein KM043_011877 [Ampulex compressa]|nr:hypothetical protein KM043_011877 [Ampulex compressa]